MKKLYLVALLTLCTLVTHAYDFAVDGIYYNITGETTVAVALNSDDKYTGDITIPSSVTYDGATYSVTSLANSAFSECVDLTSVDLPSSLTEIGTSAFNGCSGLKNISIPESVSSIGDAIFYDCTSLLEIYVPSTNQHYTSVDGILYNKDITTLICCPAAKSGELVIPNTVVTIDNYSICGCSNLTAITIPASVTAIGAWSFSGCTSITSLAIPNSVTTIEWGAFNYCIKLNSMVIPSSVTSIGMYAFVNCKSLQDLTIEDSDTELSLGNSAFSGATITSFYLGRNTDNYVVAQHAELTSLTISDKVTSISDYAFYGCSGLTSITIPSTITAMGDYAFAYCSNLNTIAIPSSVTAIPNYAFYECSGLTEISIPSSVSTIGEAAFYGCTGLTSISIPSSVTTISYAAFNSCSGLAAVTIPSSVTTIGEAAFAGCTGLKSISISASVTTIGESAFQGCSGLTSLTIPSSVTEIGYAAFAYCTGLTSVSIPASVTAIGEWAFGFCDGLKNLIIEDSEEELAINRTSFYAAPIGSIYLGRNITGYLDPGNGKLISLKIGDKVTALSNISLSDSNLTSVTIPNSVTSIGDSVFYANSGLTTIDIPSSVTSIGNYTFAFCTKLTSISLPSSVTSIGYSAFRNCAGIASITIPASVKSIGNLAFYDCSNLATFISLNPEPPQADYGFYGGANVYVPRKSVSAYKAAGDWSKFNIIGLDIVNDNENSLIVANNIADNAESEQSELKEISLSFLMYNEVAIGQGEATLTREGSDETITLPAAQIGSNSVETRAATESTDYQVSQPLGDAISESGTYTVHFPEGYFLLGDNKTNSPAFALTFNVIVSASVNEINSDEAGVQTQYYTLQGIRVKGTPAPGIYIAITGNTARKVTIK